MGIWHVWQRNLLASVHVVKDRLVGGLKEELAAWHEPGQGEKVDGHCDVQERHGDGSRWLLGPVLVTRLVLNPGRDITTIVVTTKNNDTAVCQTLDSWVPTLCCHSESVTAFLPCAFWSVTRCKKANGSTSVGIQVWVGPSRVESLVVDCHTVVSHRLVSSENDPSCNTKVGKEQRE